MFAFTTPCALGLRRTRGFRSARCAHTTRMVTTVKPDVSLSETAVEPTFGRVVTAMVTPFKRGGDEVDYDVAEQLASHLVANGSDALVIAGTTGESPTLTWSEQYELFRVVRQAVGNKAKVIAGAGSNCTREAIEATNRAKGLQLDGTLQVVPYYNKPPQDGMFQHFEAIAKAEPDLPIMLYNIPSRCGVNMSPDIVSRLASIDNIVAVKHASADTDALVQIRKNTPSNFHIYAGDDSLTLPFLALGATGVVSVASHFVGNQIQQMVRSYVNGDVGGAQEIHWTYARLFSDLFCMTNPIPTKTCLRLLGWSVGPPRLPLVDTSPELEAKLAALLAELHLM